MYQPKIPIKCRGCNIVRAERDCFKKLKNPTNMIYCYDCIEDLRSSHLYTKKDQEIIEP